MVKRQAHARYAWLASSSLLVGGCGLIAGYGPEKTLAPVPDASFSSPLDVEPAHLRLWLAADHGLTCDAGEVTRWADQSGRGNDAMLANHQRGPQCQPVDAAHTLAGSPVPYFSAPESGNIVDETLDVDLSFLAKKSFTVFIVERRWADVSQAVGTRGLFLLGTTVPVQKGFTPGCGLNGPTENIALQIGYVYYEGEPDLVIDFTCSAVKTALAPVPKRPPVAWTRDTFLFDSTVGRTVWVDGTQVAHSEKLGSLRTATGGAIGRALVTDTSTKLDARFNGDIAEVVVYDEALTNPDREAVEAHLARHWQL